MAEIREYKCPSCGGAIEFDSNTQNLKCPFCGTEMNVEDVVNYNDQLADTMESDTEWESEAGQEWKPGETDGIRVYTCNSCGGEIVTDETTAAGNCPFCGNPVVMSGQVSGVLRPDIVIPFKKDKNAAKAAFNKHLEGKTLLPRVFRDQNHIDEIKGVYVPFWLFDTDVNADICYKGTRTRAWSDNKYNYVETSYYSVLRGGNIGFNNIPADGSSKVAADLMESIEPYDMSEAVDFNTAYLSGYFADKYDVSSEDNKQHINNRVRSSTEDVFRSTVMGYTSVIPDQSNLRYSNSKARYALLPVWLLNTTWNGQQFTFAMNGQTGKFVGDLPVDEAAYKKRIAVRTVIFAVVLYLIGIVFTRFF